MSTPDVALALLLLTLCAATASTAARYRLGFGTMRSHQRFFTLSAARRRAAHYERTIGGCWAVWDRWTGRWVP